MTALRASLIAVLVVVGIGCSSAVETDPSGDPPASQRQSATPSGEPTASQERVDLREQCDRFETATLAGDRVARFETIVRMAAGDDPRPESHESFFGSDRKIWLWAQLATRAREQRDRPAFRLALEKIHAECANVD